MSQSLIETFAQEDDLSLYLHIPFCQTKCRYCDFYSICNADSAFMNRFVKKLSTELAAVVAKRTSGFKTIFVGGGNPATIGFEQLAEIVALAQKPREAAEVTVELNSESVNEDLPRLLEAGVNRISLGVQSFSQRHLSLIGRNTPAVATRQGLKRIRELRQQHSFTLSLDLMSCLPQQSSAQALEDIEIAIHEYAPEHLSFYCLTLEDGTLLSEDVQSGRITLPSDEQQGELLAAAWQRLTDLGYEHYEISNFALPGFYAEHNLRYWRLQNYLGLGPAACSTLAKEAKMVRLCGEHNVERYVTGQPFTIYQSETLSLAEQFDELLLMSLRTQWGLNRELLRNRFGSELEALIRSTQLLAETQDCFYFPQRQWLFSNRIILELSLAASAYWEEASKN